MPPEVDHDDEKRPPIPDEIILAMAEGAQAFFDEDAGQWVAGDDPGDDIDEEDLDDGPDEDAED